jgi:hypothetical protein
MSFSRTSSPWPSSGACFFVLSLWRFRAITADQLGEPLARSLVRLLASAVYAGLSRGAIFRTVSVLIRVARRAAGANVPKRSVTFRLWLTWINANLFTL